MKPLLVVIPLILAFAICDSHAAPDPSAPEPMGQAEDNTKRTGGNTFRLRIQPYEDGNGNKMAISKQQVNLTIRIVRKRLAAMGMSKWRVAAQGADGILLQLPGGKPDASQRILKTLVRVGRLELREVNPRSDETGPDGKTLAARIEAGNEIVPGYRTFPYKHKDADGNEVSTPILLNRRPALGNSDIALATPSPQQADAVSITLNKLGADRMLALTKDMMPPRDRIAIVLDGVVLTAPVVRQVPLGKNFIIEGLREPGETQNLATALMNPLECALVVEPESDAEPSGEASKPK
jgi:preprotein translocase subunit SecD